AVWETSACRLIVRSRPSLPCRRQAFPLTTECEFVPPHNFTATPLPATSGCGTTWCTRNVRYTDPRPMTQMRRTAGPGQRWARPWSGLTVLAALVHGPSCGPSEECVPGIERGERFRFTVTNVETRRGDCILAPLQAGDSFILTAGSTIDIGGGCRQRSSDGATPIFLSEIATGCQPRVGELALGCTFETDQCTGWMQL